MTHAFRKNYIPAFPKPKDVKKAVPWIVIMPDGREILNLKTAEGNAEYHRRKWAMRARQGDRCCLEGFIKDCPGFLARGATTFEHENGRSSGRQDDRIEVNGLWINGACHLWCNNSKGSRKIDYNSSIQARMNTKSATEA